MSDSSTNIRASTRLLCLTIFVLVPFSYSPGVFAGRPFTTEDAGVAGWQTIQLELSWDYLKWASGEKDHILLVAPIYGITNNIEFSLEIPYLFYDAPDVRSARGVGDVSVVTKVSILKQTNQWPAFTVKGLLKTSTGAARRGLGSGAMDYGFFAVFTKRFSRLMLHANLGLMIVGDASTQLAGDFFLYGIAARYRINRAFDLVAEISGERHPNRQSDVEPAAAMVGGAYRIARGMILDVATSLGVNDTVPDWNLTVGSSITF